jgi:hypothetical protein
MMICNRWGQCVLFGKQWRKGWSEIMMISQGVKQEWKEKRRNNQKRKENQRAWRGDLAHFNGFVTLNSL